MSAERGPPLLNAGDGILQLIAATISAGELVGAVVLVSQAGHIVSRVAAGYADREAQLSMSVDTHFRIASMTKALVSVAALALCETGVIALDDPVTRWLPAFAPALADGRRLPITIRHLLMHTAGLGYTFNTALDSPFHSLGVSDGLDGGGLTLAENVALVARAPLLFEPGSAWHYSIATDVLGCLLQAATGQSLQDLVELLVTRPCGMPCTAFHETNASRLATPYAATPQGCVRMTDPYVLPCLDSEIRYAPGRILNALAWPSAGTGMVSTAHDYLRFLEVLRLGGRPMLQPATTALFIKDALQGKPMVLGPGMSWGLGVAVVTDPVAAGLPGHAGSWGWGGVYGCHYFVDPKAELSVVCMTNTALTGMSGTFVQALRRVIYDRLAA